MVTWETTTIGNLLEFKNGLNKGKEFFGQGTPIVNYMDVYKNRGIHAEQLRGRVTLSAEEIKRFDVHKGDVFFTRTSETPEEVGYAGVMLDEIDNCVFSGFVLRGRPITDKLDISYCQYAFMTEDIRKAIMSGCTYTTRALTNGKQLSSIEIQLPEKPEQRRIAEVLSDTDALLAALEKLIAKKRAVKQGTMQELLTGKRRLPGFEGEWVEGSYRSLCEFINGRAYSQEELLSEGKYRVLRVGNFFTSERWYFSNLELSEKQYCEKGDLLYAWSASFAPRIWQGEKVIFHYHIWKTIVSPAVNKEFLYYYMVFDTQSIMGELQGGTMSHLTKETMERRLCCYPSNRDEQSAIAEILSDMDAEIGALTAKLEKARRIKQGMMSELLIGHIRLVEQEVEVAPEAVATPKIVELPKPEPKSAAAQTGGHNQQFDDAVMIAGIVNVLYSDKFPLGRKKVQKCLYLLRRRQDESTAAFKKKAAGPYADEVRYKGGEPIARSNGYIATKTDKSKGTTFAKGDSISQALGYIQNWGRQADIKWVADKLKFKKVDELELLATVDMAICDLTEAGTPVSVAAIKHLIATNEEWKAKLKRQTFSDANIAHAIRELQTLF